MFWQIFRINSFRVCTTTLCGGCPPPPFDFLIKSPIKVSLRLLKSANLVLSDVIARSCLFLIIKLFSSSISNSKPASFCRTFKQLFTNFIFPIRKSTSLVSSELMILLILACFSFFLSIHFHIFKFFSFRFLNLCNLILNSTILA